VLILRPSIHTHRLTHRRIGRLEKPPQHRAGTAGQHTRPEDVVRHVPALPHEDFVVDGQSTLRLCLGGRGDERVERRGGQHLGRGVGDVERHEGTAVVLVQVEALDFVVVVYADFVALLVVSANYLRTCGRCTWNCSVALYRVYTECLYAHGSEYICRPSTLMGDRFSEPSAFFTNLPCCHWMMPVGHLGFVATVC
jgi:hypothetical protein